MMNTRRDFLKKTILLSGAAGMSSMLPESISRAAAIDPAIGSTYLDAEHIVILMQENRSFDHCFGTLKGVRGFNDPRAIRLPDKNLVWMQTNDAKETYVPFRFDIRNTKATWMGSVPHSRASQVDANNLGKYDKWLQSKRVRDKKYAEMPLTLGYYNREDIPFYYAMADSFTVCDQAFCSAMTSTRPNRLFLWTGTIREQQNGRAKAIIRNGLDFGEAKWMTFPERLEKEGISWKVYQNDIDCGGGFTRDQRAWLANFGTNPLEWFANYHVKFSTRYIQSLKNQIATLPGEIKALKDKLPSLSAADPSRRKTQAAIGKKQEVLDRAESEIVAWSRENFDKLSTKARDLYTRAFTINDKDPDFHDLTTLNYKEGGADRELPVPKGDVLYQFREDVRTGRLPTVSWLCSAQNFSDHPSAPWYGSLYVSEVMDILTRDPEVWRKTIFIVTFDENDGYFDHIPPFVAPDPLHPETGKCSKGIDTDVEYIRLENELQEGIPKRAARGGPIGLGFRVPMLIASPWSRGGQVCSEVFDHTSILQFMEGFIKQKWSKDVREENISKWRRTVTGDLTAAFKAYQGATEEKLPFLEKDPFIEKIYNAKFRKAPSDFKPLTDAEIAMINLDPSSSTLMPRQETGIRPSTALPYQLYGEGKLSGDKRSFEINLSASDTVFGKGAAGAPFNVYIPVKYRAGSKVGDEQGLFTSVGSRSYAVIAGDRLTDVWPVAHFEHGIYHLQVYGPNGWFREFRGTKDDPDIAVLCDYEHRKGLLRKLSGNIELKVKNLHPGRAFHLTITDNAYGNEPIEKTLQTADSGESPERSIILALSKSFCWYDFSVHVAGFDHFEKRYAGRVETGRTGFTDPVMGRV